MGVEELHEAPLILSEAVGCRDWRRLGQKLSGSVWLAQGDGLDVRVVCEA